MINQLSLMRKLAILILLLPQLVFAQRESIVSAGEDIAVVETESGKVSGYIYDEIFTFKGIPYAYAERFMPPQKVEPWDDIRFMGYYGATCPLDFEGVKARGNGIGMFALQNDWGYPHEDCQNLNIWTPGINDDKKRPVMLWIHGGGYEYGSSHELPFYDGTSLAKSGDVVMVSVNHRLNVLGFLDLSEYGEQYKYSANVGLLDLVESLKWIKQNISKFGGDPENITLFGQSGGGGKITALLNSPLADGLFQKAVIQSGSFASEYKPRKDAQRVTKAIVEDLGIDQENIDDIKTVSYDQLLTAGKKVFAKMREEAMQKGEAPPMLGWGPIADDYFLPYPLFGDEVVEMIKDVSIMIGTTKTEFGGFAVFATGEDMDKTKAAISDRYGEDAEKYMDAVRKAYPKTEKASDYLALDFMFRPGAIRDANKLVTKGHENVFMYLFTWESPVYDGSLKSMHCMELPFVFNNVSLGKELTGGGKEAHELAKVVSGSWIKFARNGNPNTEGLPDWTVYTAEEGATMIFDSKSELRYHPDKELLEIAASQSRF